MVQYTLYRNKDSNTTTAIIQYMYAQDHIIIPTVIIEHGHPDHLRLPAIYEYATNVLYEGLDECVQFFEQHTGITNVLSESAAFKVLHPCFRIYDVGGKVTKHDL